MFASRKRRGWLLVVAGVMMMGMAAPAAVAHPDNGVDTGDHDHLHPAGDLSAPLAAHDAVTAGVVSSGPTAKVVKNIELRGRGERLDGDATTDVWAHEGYAYTGTFNDPCGGDPEAGIWVWDVKNPNKVKNVTVIPSPVGSRTNDVKVAAMNSGDILVHSNEPCGGGPGGFEVYNVDNPASPVHLASVQTDDINAFLRANFGFVDFGVHNLFLFTQGDRDYVSAVVESEFGNFQIFDITDPANPVLVSGWGAESLAFPAVDFYSLTDFGIILAADAYLFSGFGASANRFLHDITITDDGLHAYLSNWDAGLVLLDISNPASPSVVSVAIDPVNGSLDGEVNSHSAWPSADGSIVVEGEEDFSAWEGSIPPSNLTLQNLNTIPGVGAATSTGDAFEASPTGNAGTLSATELSVTTGPLAGQTYPVVEMVGNNHPLGGGSVAGNLVWVGRACNGDPLENALSAGDIAIVRRGACFFSDKAANVAAAGAAAVVIANNQASTPWSGLRVWDYSDPANPVLASTFDTTCSAASAPGGACDPAGTYSVHNVQVENRGNKVLAYVSWYWDGMLVLDVTDPYNPVEVGRFLNNSTNGGMPNDFWGVYKVPGSPFFYGSDRNGGLYVFKEQGSGSGK